MFTHDASSRSCGSPLLRSGSAMLPASFLVQSGGSPPLPTALAVAAQETLLPPAQRSRGFYDLYADFSMESAAPQATHCEVDVEKRSGRNAARHHQVLDCLATGALSLALVRRERLAARRAGGGAAFSSISPTQCVLKTRETVWLR